MIRNQFMSHNSEAKDKIKWRSHEPHRIEAFSDGVFAFAVSLLIISLEVPHSAKELFEMMKGFFPFCICFSLVFFIWYSQYKFFRQYGLHDIPTILLNGALLFLVLFYVYPLKFMVNLAATAGRAAYKIDPDDFVPMMRLYNSGFTGIFLLFTLMYYNAYKQREELALTPVEVFETRTNVLFYLYMTSVGMVTVLLALAGGRIAGFSMAGYGLMGGLGIVSHNRNKRFHKKFGEVPQVEPHLGSD